ncbi:hypothetical protein PMIN01_10657 [Paraphaeosphaeria minitans]|uniref:Uncharacterized protein n=1 Tax=Paraphaeosphaeria minitans TaxID=565426 RepID=A0A9P6GAW3_9PLEO|nr:hypothetical protein PMIN01_10657 [Paraphaeosphaeria minitans]
MHTRTAAPSPPSAGTDNSQTHIDLHTCDRADVERASPKPLFGSGVRPSGYVSPRASCCGVGVSRAISDGRGKYLSRRAASLLFRYTGVLRGLGQPPSFDIHLRPYTSPPPSRYIPDTYSSSSPITYPTRASTPDPAVVRKRPKTTNSPYTHATAT